MHVDSGRRDVVRPLAAFKDAPLPRQPSRSFPVAWSSNSVGVEEPRVVVSNTRVGDCRVDTVDIGGYEG